MKSVGLLVALLGLTSSNLASAQENNDVCWRDLYARGLGSLSTECAEGEEKSLGLCYPVCKNGFDGLGPLCYKAGCPGADPIAFGPLCCYSRQECTDKVVDLVIQFPMDIIHAYRDQGDIEKIIQDVKKAIEDALGFEMPVCSSSEVEDALRTHMVSLHEQMEEVWKTVFEAVEIAGREMADALEEGDSTDICWRDLYLRGMGTYVAGDCDEGLEKSLGLCYPSCQAGFTGEGPLCYAECPGRENVSAGPLCCASPLECTKKVIQLGVKLPYDLIKAYEDRVNPLKVLADLRKAIEDAMGFKMDTCPAPTFLPFATQG